MLRRSSRLAWSRDAAGREQVVNASVGRPVRLNAEAVRLLELFRAPTTPRAAAAAGLVAAASLPRLVEVLAPFVRHGLLVGPDEEHYLYLHLPALRALHDRVLAGAKQPLFHARAPATSADVVFVGVPFDRGTPARGPSGAPAALRQLSGSLPSWGGEPGSGAGAGAGLWDAACGCMRLEGVRLADVGDVILPIEDSLDAAHARITQALQQVLAGTTALPIVLGGDHSITFSALRALQKERLFLVHCDAHADMGDYGAGQPHDHANFVSRLLRESPVERVLQLGVRDVGWPQHFLHERVDAIGAYSLRGLSPADVLDRIPRGARCYLTIDIDVLDPAVAPATGHPVPGGLELPGLEAIVDAIASERQLVGADLVEISPALFGGWVTQICGLRLLMRLCDAWCRSDRRRPRCR